MVAGRVRFRPAAELLVAAVFLAATLGVGVLIVTQLNDIQRPTQVPAPSPSVVPASQPALSIPVSVLPLGDGLQLRIGDRADLVAPVLAKATPLGGQVIEPGRIGERVTRRYRYGSITFTLVFEPFERNSAMRIAAIYVQ